MSSREPEVAGRPPLTPASRAADSAPRPERSRGAEADPRHTAAGRVVARLLLRLLRRVGSGRRTASRRRRAAVSGGGREQRLRERRAVVVVDAREREHEPEPRDDGAHVHDDDHAVDVRVEYILEEEDADQRACFACGRSPCGARHTRVASKGSPPPRESARTARASQHTPRAESSRRAEKGPRARHKSEVSPPPREKKETARVVKARGAVRFSGRFVRSRRQTRPRRGAHTPPERTKKRPAAALRRDGALRVRDRRARARPASRSEGARRTLSRRGTRDAPIADAMPANVARIAAGRTADERTYCDMPQPNDVAK